MTKIYDPLEGKAIRKKRILEKKSRITLLFNLRLYDGYLSISWNKNNYLGGVDPTGADKMWKHAPASCDSEVSRETKDDLDYIVVKKSLIYRGNNAAQTLGASSIFLDDAATVTIEGKNILPRS